jgi:hypothetical protein
MGPETARSYPGRQVVPLGDRATQEIDHGRRGKGYIFGAFQPPRGEALTHPYDRRTTANWVALLERVEVWIPADVEHVYAIVDNLSAHRATDVLLFSLAHPRWEFVFQPAYAAYLNLIEPGWKILRSLALKGRASRLGSKCATLSRLLPPTGTSIGILLSGASIGVTVLIVNPVSRLYLKSREFVG